MSKSDRIRRRQILSEAEGYLDLLMIFADRWAPAPQHRDVIAQRALRTLDTVVDAGDDERYVFFLRGQAHRAMEQYDVAAKYLSQAAELDPANMHVWLALAWCQKRIRRLDLAIESLESALDFDPDEAILHYNLACYWSLAGNVKHAVEYLANAFDIDPNYRDLVGNETDFDPIRNHPDFVAAISVIV